ncbi:hypothetical protein ACLKA7_017671 [Drosophila subpalustris]
MDETTSNPSHIKSTLTDYEVMSRSVKSTPSELRAELRAQLSRAQLSKSAALPVDHAHCTTSSSVTWIPTTSSTIFTLTNSKFSRHSSNPGTLGGYLKRDNDTRTTSSEESLEALLTKHFPGCSQHDIRNQKSSSEVRLNPSPFRALNINWAINSFKPLKSPGPDGTAPAHLQRAGNIAINWLQAIFTEVLWTGQIPEPWRHSKVVFIPKAGKASP